MWYGSLVRRHGRSRPLRRYQARIARRKRRRVSGGGREAADIRLYNFTRVKIYTKTGDSGETSLFDNIARLESRCSSGCLRRSRRIERLSGHCPCGRRG